MNNIRNIIIASLLLLASPSFSAVLFEDNFDDHSDWSSGQNAWPTTAAISGDNGATDGSTACTTCPDGSAKYRGFYSASSAWDGYIGEETIQINSDNHRGDSGKAATFWMEPIDSEHCDGNTKWCSDGQLSVSLPGSYDEIYVRYFVKFDPTFVWDETNDASSGKILRISHLHELPGEPMYGFGDNGNHFPIMFLDIASDKYYGVDAFINKLFPRFQSSYRNGATPAPTYLVNGDFERAYTPGGTGYNGSKTFAEAVGDADWHCVELRMKGNSGVGVEDGEWQLWLDGESIALRTNIAWADSVYNCPGGNCVNPPSSFVGLNWVSIGGNFYNRYYSDTVHVEQYYAIDDFVISTTYVGPDYVIGGSSPSPASGHFNQTGSAYFNGTGVVNFNQ